MACPRFFIGSVVLVVLGLLCIAIGVGVIPYVLRQKIVQGLQLREDSEALKTWKNPPAPIFIEFYFFNVTNAEAFIGNETRPHVAQIGPYVYREIRNKTDVEFINDATSIRYREHKSYVFDRNRSCGDEDDWFMTINLPILTIVTQTRFMNPKITEMLKLAVELFGFHLFERHTVKELLWGYQLELPAIFKLFIKPEDVTFGIYVGASANGTDDGWYEVDAGINDITNVGRINSWKHSSAIEYWSETECNMINGSDGTGWHPFISKSEKLYIFNSELCRSLYLTYSGGATSVRGIDTLRFIPPPEIFADPVHNSENLGFCTPDASGCLLTGALNVTNCRGAPIAMSEPHFTEADPVYQNAIDGITPDPKYRTFIDIEPTTGVALNLSRQVQVNVFLRRLYAFPDTSKFSNDTMIFPILWLNEHAVIEEPTSLQLKSEVLGPVRSALILCYVLIAVGSLLLLIAVILVVVLLYRCCRSQKSYHIQVETPVCHGTNTAAAAAATDDDDVRLIDAGSG